jgi:hypothetical protein
LKEKNKVSSKVVLSAAVLCLLAGCEVGETESRSDIHQFTALNPGPPDGAKAVSPDTKLTWTGEPGMIYNVHFGKKSPPPLASKQSAAVFDPGPLDWDTTYYWRVDIVGGAEGDIWSFTTFWYGDPNGEEMDI